MMPCVSGRREEVNGSGGDGKCKGDECGGLLQGCYSICKRHQLSKRTTMQPGVGVGVEVEVGVGVEIRVGDL